MLNTKGRVIRKGPRGGEYVIGPSGRKIYTFTRAPSVTKAPSATSPRNTKGRKIYTGPKGGEYVMGPSGRKIYKFTKAFVEPVKSPEKIILDTLFIDFVKRTRPDFGPMYLSGGMGIRLITGGDVPTIDFDFVYQMTTTPTKTDYTKMVKTLKTILKDFLKEIPGTKLVENVKTLDPSPTHINTMFGKYKYGHAGFSVYIPATKMTIDLVDVVLVKQPRLFKVHSKNGMPVPSLRTIYLDTAFVMHKSLTSLGYDGWRNPIASTHWNVAQRPKYEAKGKKDINRLLLMSNHIRMNNIKSNIQRLKRAVNTRNIPTSKDIGRGLYNKIKAYRNDGTD